MWSFGRGGMNLILVLAVPALLRGGSSMGDLSYIFGGGVKDDANPSDTPIAPNRGG